MQSITAALHVNWVLWQVAGGAATVLPMHIDSTAVCHPCRDAAINSDVTLRVTLV